MTGVLCTVYGAQVYLFIHTEMEAIFQPIKKSDTYQNKLLENKHLL